MGIKVVQGVVGANAKEAAGASPHGTTPGTSQEAQASAVRAVQHAASHATLSSEAVVSTVRANRSGGIPEKIRDPERAREVAQEVAERIREDDKAGDAHSKLSSTSARAHFVS